MDTLARKIGKLNETILGLKGVVVAYSGGVDSTYLAKRCADLLGERVLAVTAVSETYPPREVQAAIEMAKTLGLRHEVVRTTELNNPEFRSNPPGRCYHCKLELFSKLHGIAEERGLPHVVDGSNLDDLSDHRPGRQAARELGVRSPLQEASLTKAEIRILSKEEGLPTWNKPSFACLASRFPYRVNITKETLDRIERAESFITSLGIAQVRLRHHGSIARIEVEPADFSIVLEPHNRQRIASLCRELGYAYATLDLAGYRSGSMNEVLGDG